MRSGQAYLKHGNKTQCLVPLLREPWLHLSPETFPFEWELALPLNKTLWGTNTHYAIHQLCQSTTTMGSQRTYLLPLKSFPNSDAPDNCQWQNSLRLKPKLHTLNKKSPSLYSLPPFLAGPGKKSIAQGQHSKVWQCQFLLHYTPPLREYSPGTILFSYS